MAGTKTHNSDLNLQGKAIISDVPNATGTILTYNSTSKEVSTRTNAEIISDLELNSGLTAYVLKSGDTMTGNLTVQYSGLGGSSGFTSSTNHLANNDRYHFRTSTSGNEYFSVTHSGRTTVSALSIKQNASNGLGVYSGLESVSPDNNKIFLGAVADSVGSYIGQSRYFSNFQYQSPKTYASLIYFDNSGKINFYGDTGLTVDTNYNPTIRATIDNTGVTSRGNVTAYSSFNSVGELQVQRLGVNRIRTNSNSLILSGDTPTGIVYVRPQGDSVGTSQVTFNGNNTSQYTDNHNILLGSQTSTGSSLFHTNLSNTIAGYGIWMAHNLQFDGTNLIQPRGTLNSWAFTANNHKGFSFNFATNSGTNGSTVSLTEVVKVDNTGKITTLNHGDSSQWKSAYDTSLNAVTTNTVQNVIETKNFTKLQKFREGIKHFDGNTNSPYLNKYENKAIYAPTAVSATGNAKITFPFTMQATMWSMKVKVLQYAAASTNTKTVQLPMTITVTGYNVSAGSGNVNFGASGNNFHSNFVGVRVGVDANNNKVVWLDFNSTLAYPKIIVEEIITHHAGSTNTLLDGNWDIQFTTDETGYTNQTTILLSDFKELVTEGKIAIWDAAGAEVGNNLKTLGNGIAKHNLLSGDAFTFRNTSAWAGGANKPGGQNGSVVNFTPYNSGGATYGFSLGARNNKLFFVTEENSVFGSWLELYHSGNFTPSNYVDKVTNEAIGGVKRFTGTYTQWMLNDDTANARGFVQSLASLFYVGTLNDKDLVLYRNDAQKVTIGSTATTFHTNINIPNATANSHGVNLGQLNSALLNYFPINFSNAKSSVTFQGDMLTVPTGSYSSAVSAQSTNLPYANSGGLISFGQTNNVSGRILSPRDNTDNWFVQSGDGTGAWRQLASREWVLTQVPNSTQIANWNSAYNFTSNFTTNYNDLAAIEALTGTDGYLRKDGNGQWSLVSSPVVDATSTISGKVKLFSDTVQSVASNAVTATASRTYGIQLNSSGQMVVNVPWVDTNTVYTLPTATSTVLGGVKLGSDTVQSVALNTVSATAGRTYGIQVNSSGQLVVNVPWADTNTSYSAGTGLNLTGTTFSVNYGTTAGTAAQGNDSRINNGQTAFSWGNHASVGYALANGSNATDTWFNASRGIEYNPYIPGKTKNASGDTYLQDATYGSVTGVLNSNGTSQGNPTDNWYHRIKMLHDNSAGYHTQIAVQMAGANSMHYKRYENGVDYGWVRLWDNQNLTQTSINNWNDIYANGIRVNIDFTPSTGNSLVLADNYFGSDSGLVDTNHERFVAGKIDEYYKYGSGIGYYDGINFHYPTGLVSIGKEITNDEDKVQVAGNISVDTFDIIDVPSQLILNPLYNIDGDVRSSRNAHIYIETGNTVRLPQKPILGQRIEIYNLSDSNITVTHDSVGALFNIPAFSKITGIVGGRGFRFDENAVPYKKYDI